MKIAVVGNADIIKKQGTIINGCDYVFRFNRAITKGYEDYKGDKTTHIGIINNGYIAKKHTIKKIDIDVLSKASQVWFPFPLSDKEYENKIRNKCNDKRFDFVYCTVPLYSKVFYELECDKYREDDCLPSTGIIIINMIIDMLKYDELLITGFDGFKTVHYWEKRKRESTLKYHNGYNEYKMIKDFENKGKLKLL